jgi:hypothetical protein
MSFSLTGNGVAGIIGLVNGYGEPVAGTIGGAHERKRSEVDDRLLNQFRALDLTGS